MEAAAFLDLYITQVDRVTATDADYSALRVQRLFDLNEVVIDFTQAFPYSWMLKPTTVTIAASDFQIALPADFDNISPKGGVWRTSDYEKLTYRDPDVIYGQRIDAGCRPALPDEYSIFNVGSTDGAQMLQTATLSASCGFSVLYKKAIYAITDASDGAFLAIPEMHQRGVIWVGMMAKNKLKEKDFRTNPAYVAAKRAAIASDQKGKEQGGQLPSFFGGR